ncbi:MAG: carotene hydroxylase [Cyclobacteriaceae bacterium]
MLLLAYILVTLGTFFFMEFVAWFTHKYIMHGFLWYLHKDHHQKKPGFFEKNDAFFLIFAIPSSLCFIFGAIDGYDFKTYIGIGIALYGATYFLVHDIIIHQRFNLLKHVSNTYLKAIRKAHHIHHTVETKHYASCFGMLLVPVKYHQEAKQMTGKNK